MPSMEDRSLVLLLGAVSGDIQIRSGSDARFSLACGGDLLYVRAFDPKQIRVCQALRDGDRVVVVGSLHSFVHNRCRSHHAWVKALAVAPGSGEHLADELSGLFGLWWESEAEATSIARSITESSLAERLLAEYEERCRHASEVTATYVYTLHARGGATLAIDWLRACIAPVGGITLDQVEDWRQVVHPDDAGLLDEHLRLLASGQPHTVEFRLVMGGGEPRRLRDDARPVLEAGQVVRIYGVVQDITDRRWLETQVLELQRMAAVNRLAGGIAHEFNNLLTLIMSRVELMRYRLGEDYELLRDDVEEIGQATQQAAWLTRRLLAFSRRKMVLPELLDLKALVADLGQALRRVVGEDIEFVVTVAPDVGCVRADQGQVEQILVNLVIHLCDHLPQGGRLTLETAGVWLDEAQAREAGLAPGSYARVTVGGVGSGLDHAAPPPAGGDHSGVGLSVARQVAGLMGVHLRTEVRPGDVRFSLYLPQVSDAEVVETVKGQAALPPAETILLVEDEDRVRSLAGHILQINGFTVLEARSGEEALELYARHAGPVHVVVADVMLPGMSGPELVERLAAGHPRLKVVFVSGYVDTPFAPPPGAPFLRKPFAVGELVRAVYRALVDDASWTQGGEG